MENERGPEAGQENLSARIRELLLLMYEIAHEEGKGEAVQDKLVAFARGLEERYPDVRDYEVFHAMIGSTPVSGKEYKKGDFPRKDSVELFLTNTIAELRGLAPRVRENPWLEGLRKADKKAGKKADGRYREPKEEPDEEKNEE